MATKTTTPKTARNRSTRKYGPAAGKQVALELHEMHLGKLKSGRSGVPVTDPKQAIAIGLSEARKRGVKMPPDPRG